MASLKRLGCLTLGLLACLALPSVTWAASEPSNFHPFAPDSVWNLPLRADVPLAANSTGYVQALAQSVTTAGAWINTTSCGMPIYWADPTTPRVSVTLVHPSYQDPALMRAWSAVPIPANAQPAACNDKNFAVVQQQPDGALEEWEFFAAAHNPDGSWTANWGGAINDIRSDRGIASSLAWQDPTAPDPIARHSTPGWNVTASSVSMIAGVVTNADLAAGQINHALAMAVPAAAAGRWLWPAQRTDGNSSDPNALPEGAHLRLDPNLDLSKLQLAPIVRMLAQAAQRYGIIVRDQASTNVFYAEQPAPGQPDPVLPLLGGQSMPAALAAFPWSRLQVLDAPACTDFHGCSATQKAVINVDGSLSAGPVVGSTVMLDTTNSVLNFPRTKVEWDLDGDGTYETAAGVSTSYALKLTTPGLRTVGVRITAADGSVVTGTTTLNVMPDPTGASPSTTTTSTSTVTTSTSTTSSVTASTTSSDPGAPAPPPEAAPGSGTPAPPPGSASSATSQAAAPRVGAPAGPSSPSAPPGRRDCRLWAISPRIRMRAARHARLAIRREVGVLRLAANCTAKVKLRVEAAIYEVLPSGSGGTRGAWFTTSTTAVAVPNRTIRLALHLPRHALRGLRRHSSAAALVALVARGPDGTSRTLVGIRRLVPVR